MRRPLAGALQASLQLLAVISLPGQAVREPGVPTTYVPRAHATMVAATVALPFGSAHDPPNAVGAARVLGLALERWVSRGLVDGEATVDVDVGRERTLVTLLATPDGWSRDFQATLDRLFRRAVPDRILERARSDVRSGLIFQEDDPGRQFEAELALLLFGPSHAWTRASAITSSSVEALGLDDVRALRAAHVKVELARAVVLGAVGDGSYEAPSALPVESPRRSEEPHWTAGARKTLVRDITNGWVGVAFALPSDVPTEVYDLVALSLERTLVTDPPAPDLFGLRAAVEAAPSGSMLVLRGAVAPDAAERWEARILDAVARLATAPPTTAVLDRLRRRRRAELALSAASPEAESRFLIGGLGAAPRSTPTARVSESLTPEDVVRAITRLGEPRVLLVAPAFGNGSGERGGSRDGSAR